MNTQNLKEPERTIYTLKKRNPNESGGWGNPGKYVAHEFNTDSQEWEVMFEK